MKMLKREEIYANNYVDLDHLRTNIEAFINQHYSRCRLHSALGYQSPEAFEGQLDSTVTAASPTMSFFRHAEDYRPDETNTSRGPASITRSGPQTAPQAIGFDVSLAGYSLVSCSPAELGSASPADGNSEAEAFV